MPDVHYGDDRHWVSGDLGVSEWLLTGTTADGQKVRVRGCDHWEFRGGKIVRKDSYWKIVDASAPATGDAVLHAVASVAPVPWLRSWCDALGEFDQGAGSWEISYE